MRRRLACALSAAMAVCLLSGAAEAATYTWTAGTGTWNVAANWSPSTGYPGAADTAYFAAGSPSGTVSLGGDQSVWRLEYQAGTPGWTIQNNTLYLGAGGIVMGNDPGGAETISSAITLTAPVTIDNQSNWPGEKALNLNGTFDSAGHDLIISSAHQTYFNGKVTGSGDVTISGGTGSTYFRSNTSDFTGCLEVEAGTALVDSNGSVLSTPDIRINGSGSTLRLGSTGTSRPDDGVTTFGRVGNSTPITMTAGTLSLVGSGTTAERFGDLTLRTTVSNIRVNNADSSSTATLIPDEIVRHAGSRPVAIVGSWPIPWVTSESYVLGVRALIIPADGGASLTKIGGTNSRGTDKAVIPYMATPTTGGYSNESYANALVYYDATNGLTPMNPTTDYVLPTGASFPAVNADGNDNVRLPWTVVHPTASPDPAVLTLSSSTTVNSLVFDNDKSVNEASQVTLTGAAGTTLTVKSGAIMLARSGTQARAATVNFDVPTLAFGSAEGVIMGMFRDYSNLNVNSAITGTGGLTLYRSGQTNSYLRLGGANSGLSGPITIVSGQVWVGHRNALGDGTNQVYLGEDAVLVPNAAISGGQTLTIGALAGHGDVERVWNASSKSLNIGGDGTGGADNTVRLLAGGLLSPGDADMPGTIQFTGDFTTVYLMGGTLQTDLFGLGEANADSVAVTGTGTVSISGGMLDVNSSGFWAWYGQEWTILSAAGTITDPNGGMLFDYVTPGWEAYISGGNSVTLFCTIPEPGTCLLLALGGLAGMLRARREGR